MVAQFSIMAALAAVASAAVLPRAPVQGEFNLVTEVTSGETAFNGIYINAFHTGAGESAAVGTSNSSDAASFRVNNNFLELTTGNPSVPVFSFGLDSFSPGDITAAPQNLYVDLNAGDNTAGFSLNGFIVQYEGSIDFTTFTMCYVDGIAPYQSAGPQNELFWRNSTSTGCSDGCADVQLKAIY